MASRFPQIISKTLLEILPLEIGTTLDLAGEPFRHRRDLTLEYRWHKESYADSFLRGEITSGGDHLFFLHGSGCAMKWDVGALLRGKVGGGIAGALTTKAQYQHDARTRAIFIEGSDQLSPAEMAARVVTERENIGDYNQEKLTAELPYLLTLTRRKKRALSRNAGSTSRPST